MHRLTSTGGRQAKKGLLKTVKAPRYFSTSAQHFQEKKNDADNSAEQPSQTAEPSADKQSSTQQNFTPRNTQYQNLSQQNQQNQQRRPYYQRNNNYQQGGNQQQGDQQQRRFPPRNQDGQNYYRQNRPQGQTGEQRQYNRPYQNRAPGAPGSADNQQPDGQVSAGRSNSFQRMNDRAREMMSTSQPVSPPQVTRNVSYSSDGMTKKLETEQQVVQRRVIPETGSEITEIIKTQDTHITTEYQKPADEKQPYTRASHQYTQRRQTTRTYQEQRTPQRLADVQQGAIIRDNKYVLQTARPTRWDTRNQTQSLPDGSKLHTTIQEQRGVATHTEIGPINASAEEPIDIQQIVREHRNVNVKEEVIPAAGGHFQQIINLAQRLSRQPGPSNTPSNPAAAVANLDILPEIDELGSRQVVKESIARKAQMKAQRSTGLRKYVMTEEQAKRKKEAAAKESEEREEEEEEEDGGYDNDDRPMKKQDVFDLEDADQYQQALELRHPAFFLGDEPIENMMQQHEFEELYNVHLLNTYHYKRAINIENNFNDDYLLGENAWLKYVNPTSLPTIMETLSEPLPNEPKTTEYLNLKKQAFPFLEFRADLDQKAQIDYVLTPIATIQEMSKVTNRFIENDVNYAAVDRIINNQIEQLQSSGQLTPEILKQKEIKIPTRELAQEILHDFTIQQSLLSTQMTADKETPDPHSFNETSLEAMVENYSNINKSIRKLQPGSSENKEAKASLELMKGLLEEQLDVVRELTPTRIAEQYGISQRPKTRSTLHDMLIDRLQERLPMATTPEEELEKIANHHTMVVEERIHAYDYYYNKHVLEEDEIVTSHHIPDVEATMIAGKYGVARVLAPSLRYFDEVLDKMPEGHAKNMTKKKMNEFIDRQDLSMKEKAHLIGGFARHLMASGIDTAPPEAVDYFWNRKSKPKPTHLHPTQRNPYNPYSLFVDSKKRRAAEARVEEVKPSV